MCITCLNILKMGVWTGTMKTLGRLLPHLLWRSELILMHASAIEDIQDLCRK